MSRGFTLLEVLVALSLLGLAIVTLMQLSSQGLRLLRVSEDYQRAALVADHVARSADTLREGSDAGRDGAFRWERRVALVPVPEELAAGVGVQPHLYALTVAVRWGNGRSFELASLRTVGARSGP